MRHRLVRLVARLARVLDPRPAGETNAPIDPALLPIDLAEQPMTFH